MDRINIDNLFPADSNHKPLDVYTLYNEFENKNNNKNDFDVNKLSTPHEERKKKILLEYYKIYNMCLKKIVSANNLKKTDLIYTLPLSQFNWKEFSLIDCLSFIENRLRRQDFDTLVLSDTSIFISWLKIVNRKEKLSSSLT